MAGANEAKKSSLLDDIRSDILGAKPEHREVTWKGHKLELREPPAGEVLNFQRSMEEDADMASMTMTLLVRYLFTPQGEKVFSEADVEALLSVPYGKEFQDILTKVNELMGVAVTPDTKSGAAAQSGDVGDSDSGKPSPSAGNGSDELAQVSDRVVDDLSAG